MVTVFNFAETDSSHLAKGAIARFAGKAAAEQFVARIVREGKATADDCAISADDGQRVNEWVMRKY